jgi:hypothetical protein
MSKCFRCLLAAALVALAPALPQGNEVPFSITITAAQSLFMAGSEVTIRLVFKNTSDHEVPYTRGLGTGVEAHGEFFTDVAVRDASGELVPETKYHRVLRGKDDTSASQASPEKTGEVPATSGPPKPRLRFRGSFTGVMLKPGEFREEDIVVSKLYDLSQPGQYTISASRRLSDVSTDPQSKLVAKSNTLKITIIK